MKKVSGWNDQCGAHRHQQKCGRRVEETIGRAILRSRKETQRGIKKGRRQDQSAADRQ
jgi:hypothetical protein